MAEVRAPQSPPRRMTVAVTSGEPAGIGPEVAIRAAWALRERVNCVLLGDAAFLAMTAQAIDPSIRLVGLSPQALRNSGLPHFADGVIAVIDCQLAAHVEAGVLDVRNARPVLHTLDLAIEGCKAGWFDAIATAPLQKSIINDAGVAFSGHTEYLAQKTATAQVVMMLAASVDYRDSSRPPCAADSGAAAPSMLRVALATTHLPLKDVAAAITPASLAAVLDILDADLRNKFGLAQARILVAGLNPHAGEGGYLGHEEIDIIAPAIASAQARGIRASGPYPADTLFQAKYLRDADCVLAMYHDQGLPVLKYASFGRGVNITLGLPLIRTSVDHGTALDLARAGLGHADCASMIEAITIAAAMAATRIRHQ
jgi:4-hydroxythreonine-4-phosphate dehydrogenase